MDAPPSFAEQIEVYEALIENLIRSFTVNLPGDPDHGKITEPGIERELVCIRETIKLLERKQAEEVCGPLASIVLQAFKEDRFTDALKLAGYLGATAIVDDPKAMDSYTLVAKDVLDRLEQEGYVRRTKTGWYEAT